MLGNVLRVDLAYLRAHPEHLQTFLTHQRIRETPISGGSISQAARLTLDDGASVFMKSWPDPSSRTSPASTATAVPDGFFEAEAEGLRWLAAAGGAPVPELIAATSGFVALEWVEPATPTGSAAHEFGAALARTHRAGADAFGAPWSGYIGSLPLDNTRSRGPWSAWFAERRLRPYLRMAADSGALPPADVADVDRLIDNVDGYAVEADAEVPARLHGDLWPGNLIWSGAGPVYLIDPAAHGGHRETDLAQLALFGGAPHLAEIIAGYETEWPLSSGWRSRVPLHQLHLLLVHVAMFGAGYRDAVMSAVRATVEQ